VGGESCVAGSPPLFACGRIFDTSLLDTARAGFVPRRGRPSTCCARWGRPRSCRR